MSDLPSWVWDTVIALQKHRDEHPQYLAEYYPDYKPRRAATCGCEPLAHVPSDIKAIAEAIAEDRNRRPSPAPSTPSADGAPAESNGHDSGPVASRGAAAGGAS